MHRDFQPKTGTVDAVSSPAGFTLGVGSGTGAPPPAVTGIGGSHVTVTAPASVTMGEDVWTFSNWSDGGARNHAAKIVNATNHLTATYAKTASDASNTCSSASTISPTGAWHTGRLSTDTDVDWYKFSMTSTGTVRIVLGNLPEDASLSLYSGCSKLLITSDRGGTNTEEIFRTLAKGSYAVRVTTKGTASTDLYSMNVRRLASGLALVSSSTRIDGSSLIIVGEVYNGTSTTQGPSMITVKLYNAAGHLLATRTGRTDMLRPARGPSAVPIVGSVPAGYAKAVVTVRARHHALDAGQRALHGRDPVLRLEPVPPPGHGQVQRRGHLAPRDDDDLQPARDRPRRDPRDRRLDDPGRQRDDGVRRALELRRDDRQGGAEVGGRSSSHDLAEAVAGPQPVEGGLEVVEADPPVDEPLDRQPAGEVERARSAGSRPAGSAKP